MRYFLNCVDQYRFFLCVLCIESCPGPNEGKESLETVLLLLFPNLGQSEIEVGLQSVRTKEERISTSLFYCSVAQLCLTPQPHGLQHARLLCPSLSPRVCSNSCPLTCHPTISSSAIPFPPALNLSQYRGLFWWVSSYHQMAKILELQLQHQSFQWIVRIYFLLAWLVWLYCLEALNCTFHPHIFGCHWKVLHFTVGVCLIKVLFKLIKWLDCYNSLRSSKVK